MLSLETLNICYQILCATQVTVGAPNFEEMSVVMARAKRELAAAIEESDKK